MRKVEVRASAKRKCKKKKSILDNHERYGAEGGAAAVVWPGRGGLVPRGLPRMVCKCKLARGSRGGECGPREAVVLWEALVPSTLKADGIFGCEDSYYTVCRHRG